MFDYRVTYRTTNHARCYQTGAHLFHTEAEAKKFMRRLPWWRQAHLQSLRGRGGQR